MANIQNRKSRVTKARVVKSHYGLGVLRSTLASAFPEFTRAGQLMPKHLAQLAGVNYETMRQLCNGGLDFTKDRPLYRMIAINLSLMTGVHPDFRTTPEGSAVVDVWGDKYNSASYAKWIDRGLTSDKLEAGGEGITNGRMGGKVPGLIERIKPQTSNLLTAVLKAAASQGAPTECLAYHLLKHALVGVARDLGVMDKVDVSQFADYCISLGGGPLADQGVEPTTFIPSRWTPDAPAITVQGVKLEASYPEFVAELLDTLESLGKKAGQQSSES